MKRKVRNITAKPADNSAQIWIRRLQLQPHPEGGYFREVYRSHEIIPGSCLPERFEGQRNIATSIVYLLRKGEFSAFHRIKSDETWYFHDGGPLEIFIIDQNGKLIRITLGLKDDSIPQCTINAGQWFAARTTAGYTLAGCAVAPGFDFRDFEMGVSSELITSFPLHEKIITELCKG